MLILMAGQWLLDAMEESWFRWLSFALALVVQVVGGKRFYLGAWRQIKVGASNMDTLVSLGSGTAFLFSTWLLLSGSMGHAYFVESISIIALVSLGHWLESFTSGKAESSLKALMHLAPETARQWKPGGGTVAVPVSQLQVGDFIELKPGDKIPVDATVTEGHSTVDESMLTGESMPQEKGAGHLLYAGTLNNDGRFVARVTSTGQATALAQIIEAVSRAQNSRAAIQRLGDRVSSVFVPVVVCIALVTALWWGFNGNQARSLGQHLMPFLWHVHWPETALAAAIVHAVAVLIVACPCAMGLATPIAIMAGTNAAARRGVLIRDGIALERASKITAVVFDKTGTLTSGKPVIAASLLISNEATELAASMGRGSRHPLSQVIARLQHFEDDLHFQDWREIPGSGSQATFEGKTVRLGSIAFLQTEGVQMKPGEAFLKEWSARGATLLGVSMDAELSGLFALTDELKAGARKVVGELQGSGLKIYIASGDHPDAVMATAGSIGIVRENVRAGISPVQKAAFITELQKNGESVAFVGDGINDSPALESADLGIAVSKASDVAREAADLILLRSELEVVPEALALARDTMRTIRQNLFWAFFYNCVGIPLAALGFMSPILCALSMGMSDLVVVGNALRLLRWKKR